MPSLRKMASSGSALVLTLLLVLSHSAALHADEDAGVDVPAAIEAAIEIWSIPTLGNPPAPEADAAPAADPVTFPDEDGFQARRAVLIEGLAHGGLDRWRRGYFSGGDPGKYLACHAMAKLILNPDDEEPRRYQNDNRAYREHYHFACLNWSRYLPLFGDTLTEDTKKKLAGEASRYTALVSGGGTENHKTMWYTSGILYPHIIESDRIAQKPRGEVITWGKDWLRGYVRELYHYGQGEWDSSTYLMFNVHGMLNLYDFHPDPEIRLLARAALDWYITSYAIKYRDGIFTAPNQRGFYSTAMQSISDQTGWLWWGSPVEVTPHDARGWRYAIHAALSAWRPNKVITAIARKEGDTPFVQKNTKPNYYFGQRIAPKAHVYRETVTNGARYTLGSLWNGGGSQMTKLMLVISNADAQSPHAAPVAFTGGSPTRFDHNGNRIGFGYGDGISVRDQIAQVDGLVVCLTENAEDDPLAYSFFSLPAGVTPEERDGWWVMEVGGVWVGVHGLGTAARLGEAELTDRQKSDNERALAAEREPRHVPDPILLFEGHRSGFVLAVNESIEASSKSEGEATFRAFLAALSVDASAYAADGIVTATTPQGRALTVARAPGSPMTMAKVTVNGEVYDPSTWDAMYDGPYVNLKDGILRVTDGTDGFVVDFSAEMPVYKPYEAPSTQE